MLCVRRIHERACDLQAARGWLPGRSSMHGCSSFALPTISTSWRPGRHGAGAGEREIATGCSGEVDHLWRIYSSWMLQSTVGFSPIEPVCTEQTLAGAECALLSRKGSCTPFSKHHYQATTTTSGYRCGLAKKGVRPALPKTTADGHQPIGL